MYVQSYNYINMKINNSKIEGIGLILLLLSFGWQAFQQDISDLAKDQQDYQIHEKLDNIWNVITDMYTHSSSNTSNASTKVNIEAALENWKLYGNILSERTTVEYQAKLFLTIQIILYILGSICLIIPKFRNEKH